MSTPVAPTRHSAPGALLRWGFALLVGSVALFAVACGSEADTPSAGTAPQNAVTRDSDDGGFAAQEDKSEGAGAYGAPAPSGPAADGASGGGAAVTNLPSTLGRTILRDGSIGLEVESVAQSFDRVRQIAEGAGGFVADSNFSGSGADQSASLTLRVPAERFGDVIAQLQGLAVEVQSISSNSQDVTEEYTDLQSALRNLRAVEERYLVLLGQAEEIDDILLVQDRLNGVRYEIERVQGRINLLDNLASLATIRVHLVPVPAAVEETKPVDPGFTDRVADAWASSLEAIEAVGTALAVAVVWSWWLLPFVAVGAWLARRYAIRAAARDRVDTPEGAA